jgi:nucleotide-binding universal stress UspA family protein
MYDEILIPTDGSEGASEAIARALDLARVAEARIHVLSVVQTGTESGGPTTAERTARPDQEAASARDAIEGIREQAAATGRPVESAVRDGSPAEEIRDYVATRDIDLVVMGTHGRANAERSGLGSTTQRVITRADVPVLSVRLSPGTAPESGYAMYDHVVIPTDGSDVAERAADRALEIAEHYGADVHVVYVVDPTTYDQADAQRSIVGLLKEGGQRAVETIATEAGDRNLPVTSDLLRGSPAEEIGSYATGVDADLIALGTRGRSAASDKLLGGTTARLVRQSEIPILTVA